MQIIAVKAIFCALVALRTATGAAEVQSNVNMIGHGVAAVIIHHATKSFEKDVCVCLL